MTPEATGPTPDEIETTTTGEPATTSSQDVTAPAPSSELPTSPTAEDGASTPAEAVDATPAAASTPEPDDVREPAADSASATVAEPDSVPKPVAVPEAVAPPATPTPADSSPVPDTPINADTDGSGAASAPAVSTPPATSAPASVAPAAPKPATPRPVPRPRAPKPAPPRPGSPVPDSGRRAKAPKAAGPAPAPIDPAEEAEAARWGRADDDGTVWVRESAGERAVGQYPGAGSAEALAYFVRKYIDLLAQVRLFAARLDATDLAVKEIDSTLAKLTEALAEPAAVGDIDGLRATVETLRGRAAERRSAVEAANREAKVKAAEERAALVERAEEIAGRDPSRTQWRQSGDEFRKLLDEWKQAQSRGPRIDRPTEEALWKRFSQARTTFDRQRRHFFAALEERNSEARQAKEQLIAEAETLAASTDWGPTAGVFRDLMTRWKAAGHAGRKEDDALWARFRAAQDQFFDARSAANAELDAEFQENLTAKLALLEEMEKLVPVRDLAAAKSALRRFQDQWDAIGKVPRADIQRVDARIRAVEQAVRGAEDDAWRRSNPETKARAEGLAAQLESAIAGLEKDLEAAKAAGNAKKIAEAEAALTARREWLAQARSAQDEFSG